MEKAVLAFLENKKRPLACIAIGVFLLLCMALLPGKVGPFSKGPTFPEFVKIKIGEVEISAEIADTDAKRAQGLSGRETLGEYEGMLFVFPRADYYGFWMKDMRFPIDIVWIGEDMRIVGITKNVSPETFPEVFRPPLPARYVLETKSGLADTRAIEIGESISLRDLLQ